jgi:hypothetical protein
MITYGVCYYFHGDIKDLKKFDNYNDAMVDYLTRLPIEYAKLGYIPKNLGIIHYDNNEEVAFETITGTNIKEF